MELTPIESRSIAAVGFDEATGTLSVQFKSGQVYDYPASREVFDNFMAADSKGRHFHEVIRPLGGTKREPEPE